MRYQTNILLAVLCWLVLAGTAHAVTPPCAPPNSREVELTSQSLEGNTVTIPAHLLKPEGAGPFPALVLLHG